jgi:hypothetical protein
MRWRPARRRSVASAIKKRDRSGIQRKICRRHHIASATSPALDPRPSTRRWRARPRMTRAHGGRRHSKRTRRPAKQLCATGRLAERESVAQKKSGSGAREAPKAFRNLRALLLRSAAGALFHLKRYGRFLIPPAGVLHTPSIAPNPAFAPWAVTSLRANDHLRPTPNLQTVSRLSAVGRGEVRRSMWEVGEAGIISQANVMWRRALDAPRPAPRCSKACTRSRP